MDRTRSVLDTLKAAAPDAAESELRNLLGGFGFSGEAVDKRVEVLSGGERIRLAFARILARPPNLLLLDEPTTHLDVESREALQDALAAYEGTVVLVSHDVAFVRAVAQGIVAVAPDGGGVRRFAGGYDYYREKTAGEDTGGAGGAAEPAMDQDKAARVEAMRDRKALKAELRRAEKELAGLEKEIANLEKEQAELHRRLAAPETPADRRAADGRRLKEIEDTLSIRLSAWEEAGNRRDSMAASK